VMRSLLEHTTLFACLAIEHDNGSRTWKARDPDQNTLWWMVDQYGREKKLTEDQEQSIGGVLDDQMRRALRAMKKRVRAIPSRGQFPTVEELAAEVDAHWAPRLAGWVEAEPRTPQFAVTFRGHYWTLYTRGSSSVHPDYGAIRRFLTPPTPSGYQRHYLSPEATGDQVGVFVSIAAFLMADGIAVAEAALGWGAYDDALRVLGRWEVIRGPDMLVTGVRLALANEDGRRFGRAGNLPVCVEIGEGEVSIVVVGQDSKWTRLRHSPGTREWRLLEADRDEVTLDMRRDEAQLLPAIVRGLDVLAETDWASDDTARPHDWPEGAP